MLTLVPTEHRGTWICEGGPLDHLDPAVVQLEDGSAVCLEHVTVPPPPALDEVAAEKWRVVFDLDVQTPGQLIEGDTAVEEARLLVGGAGEWEKHLTVHPIATALDLDGTALCPVCGSVTFRYEENEWQAHPLVDDEERTPGVLAFDGDVQHGDGDDDPGIVCARCGVYIELPSTIVLEWA